MPDEPKSRLQITVSPGELKALDDWSFEQRIRSRSEAIRRLIKIGLAAQPHLADVLAYLERAGDQEDREVQKAVAELRNTLGREPGL